MIFVMATSNIDESATLSGSGRSRWFTLKEAAVIARRSENAMRQLRINEKGPRFRKVDGRLLVSAEDLERWLDGETDTSGAA